MVKFIKNIIYYSMADILMAEKTSQKALSASLDKTDKKFILKLYRDSNAIASRTPVHFFLHNTTYFKYETAMTRKCQFDFSRPCVEEIKGIELGFINISWNNL